MGLSDELRDPWGLLLAGVVGGLSWAVGVPVAAAAGVGAVVYGVKAVTGAVINRDRQAPGAQHPIRYGSPEFRWVQRAERALSSFRRLGETAPAGMAERAQRMGQEAGVTLDAVKRLASQASALAIAENRIDEVALGREHERLTQALRRAPDAQRVELERALDSVRSQLAADERLRQANETLLARLQATVLGLEGLTARLVEVLAMAQTQSVVVGAQQIDELSDELEGLRAGLAETEDVSRSVLDAYRPAGTADRQGWERGDRDVEAP